MASGVNVLYWPVFLLESDVSKTWETQGKVGSFAAFGPLMSPYWATEETASLLLAQGVVENSGMNVKHPGVEITPHSV